MQSNTRRRIAALVIGALAAVGVTACTQQIQTADTMCGFLLGKGGNDENSNRTVNKIKHPGEKDTYDDSYDNARYFPCGPRNYIVSPQSKDPDGTILLTAHTKQGTLVNIEATAYWTPNQHTGEIDKFIDFCQGKYDCATGDQNVTGANFATDGWNGMLRENMHYVLQRVAAASFPQVDDAIWIKDDPTQKDSAAKLMSDAFGDEMQKTSGFTVDLFCASGSEGNADTFDCKHVRIVVDKVTAANADLQNQSDAALAQQRETDLKAAAADARISLTDKLYGSLAPQYRACEDLGTKATCVIGGNSVQVAPAVPAPPK